MKKLLALLLAAVMVFGLVACGGSADAPATDAPADNGGETPAAPVENTSSKYSAENPYHLVFAFIEVMPQDDAARQAVEDAMNEYLIPTYNIEVEFLPLGFGDWNTTIQLMMSGGDALDVIPITSAFASSWSNMDGIVDMMPYMETEDGQKIVDAIGDRAYMGQMNSILYGFPANKESIEIGGIWMRADVCDELGITEKYGLELHKDEYEGEFISYAELEEILTTVKEAKPDMTPLYLGNSSKMSRFMFWDTLSDNFGVLNWQADHDTTEVVNLFETQEYKDRVTMLARWYDKGLIYKDAATDSSGDNTMVRAGNTFGYMTAIKPGFLAEATAANGMDGYVLYVVDQQEGGIASHNINFFNTGICSNSEDPAMAFKFITAMYTDPKVMNFWQFGIEGVNYQVLEDGTAYYVEGESDANFKYHQNTGWLLGNQYIGHVWNDGSKTPDYWEKLIAHDAWSYPSAATGFAWDSTDYATQITALTNVLSTYQAALDTGSVGEANVESTLKALNDALYAAGLQEVMDAKQAQLDAWLAAQEK